MTALAADEPEIGAALLSAPERRLLGLRLSLAMITAGLLVLSAGLSWFAPDEPDLAQLVAGIAAALVAVPVLTEAWHSLRRPSLHGITDQLVAIALIAAWAVGDLMTAALLPLAMIIGHVLEERSLLGSAEAIAALTRLTRVTARRLGADGSVREVPAESLVPGDRVETRPGDRVPADGVIETGASSIDTAAITGESVPREVAPGATVLAGTINLAGRLEITVTKVGGETVLGRIVSLVRVAERSKPPVTRLLERYSGRYMTLVLAVAAASWFATRDVGVLMAVLVAACPCALVLAAPATAIAAIAVAGRHGILIKGAAFLEELASVDSLILDKTGTVTRGELRLIAVVAPDGGAEEASAVAAALGRGSTHPVSRAAAVAGSSLVAEDLVETSGLGVAGRVDGATALLGRPEFLAEHGIQPGTPPEHDGPIAGVARDGVFLGWLLFADEPRPEAFAALADLRALGLVRQTLLTGDRASVAQAIGRAVGITDVVSEALPAEKLARVTADSRAGFRPLVVGDGVNDALALKAGAVGIAMGANGTDVALASADLVLMTSDLTRLGTCIRLSRRCRRTITTNVVIGLGWTLVVVAVAGLGGLGASGALVAALLHNAGTLAVMANAGRLLKFDETAKS